MFGGFLFKYLFLTTLKGYEKALQEENLSIFTEKYPYFKNIDINYFLNLACYNVLQCF